MAETEVLEPVIHSLKEVVVETLNETVGNASDPATEVRVPSTPEGLVIAYGSLVFMALLPILIGSFRSVKQELLEITSDQNEPVVANGADVGVINGLFAGSQSPGEPVEGMSSKDAAMFPLIASVALFGIYNIFKLFSASSINLLVSSYFFVLGVFTLMHLLTPIIARVTRECLKRPTYQLMFLQRDENEGSVSSASGIPYQMPFENLDPPPRHRRRSPPEEILNFEFNKQDLLSLFLCALVGSWYFWTKHWIANNLFGLSFAINGVEFLQLPRVSTGFVLLGGLFVYDIFWVFFTDVMITVAKSIDAPIKLLFPQDILEKGPLEANNFAMLGLGDIVIPGIFIALLLRFDLSRDNQKRGSKPYFYAGFVAYFLGLMLTIFVMHVYKHAQPALLYLVPACLGVPMLLALAKGEIKALLNYEDELPKLVDDEEEEEEEEDGWEDDEEEEREEGEDLMKKDN